MYILRMRLSRALSHDKNSDSARSLGNYDATVLQSDKIRTLTPALE